MLAWTTFILSCSSEKDTDVTPAPAPGSGQEEGPGTGTPPETPKPSVPLPTGVTAQKVKNPKEITDFLVQLPATYNDDPNKKWPVIFFLHGMGERGDDINIIKRASLAAIAAKDANFPYILISPQCKTPSWWNIPSLEVLHAQVMSDYKVDPSRIYLTGLSMGGFGAWTWAQTKPERFAAVVPICGEGTPASACVLKDKPLWVFHNADDPTVPVKGSQDMVKALRDCGSTLVKYTENESGGHDAWTKAYSDPALFTWLNQQSKK
ncbi:alpha/beta hydrolase-fold protein [Chitinophaga pollutisoli]|uniref:Alpha/beta hydrolase-fold protein n=1 Tax=Chitinophaga pollutisoli TaxID=3133966 RepID=A0ABZ2YKL2_9BACT